MSSGNRQTTDRHTMDWRKQRRQYTPIIQIEACCPRYQRGQTRRFLFAATPPLEAKKILFSLAVTEGVGYRHKKVMGIKLDFIDIRRACFHSKARREIHIQLPREDHTEGMCGILNKAMYGTRDAAQNWEYEYSEFMETVGFRRGKASPCIF